MIKENTGIQARSHHTKDV